MRQWSRKQFSLSFVVGLVAGTVATVLGTPLLQALAAPPGTRPNTPSTPSTPSTPPRTGHPSDPDDEPTDSELERLEREDPSIARSLRPAARDGFPRLGTVPGELQRAAQRPEAEITEGERIRRRLESTLERYLGAFGVNIARNITLDVSQVGYTTRYDGMYSLASDIVLLRMRAYNGLDYWNDIGKIEGQDTGDRRKWFIQSFWLGVNVPFEVGDRRRIVGTLRSGLLDLDNMGSEVTGWDTDVSPAGSQFEVLYSQVGDFLGHLDSLMRTRWMVTAGSLDKHTVLDAFKRIAEFVQLPDYVSVELSQEVIAKFPSEFGEYIRVRLGSQWLHFNRDGTSGSENVGRVVLTLTAGEFMKLTEEAFMSGNGPEGVIVPRHRVTLEGAFGDHSAMGVGYDHFFKVLSGLRVGVGYSYRDRGYPVTVGERYQQGHNMFAVAELRVEKGIRFEVYGSLGEQDSMEVRAIIDVGELIDYLDDDR